jgi:hypothetical protein
MDLKTYLDELSLEQKQAMLKRLETIIELWNVQSVTPKNPNQ